MSSRDEFYQSESYKKFENEIRNTCERALSLIEIMIVADDKRARAECRKEVAKILSSVLSFCMMPDPANLNCIGKSIAACVMEEITKMQSCEGETMQ